MAELNVSIERRAQIGQAKRVRTRNDILAAAFALLGREDGHTTRIEDICSKCRISRGTFYNYFASFEELSQVLRYEITHNLNVGMYAVISNMRPGAERVMGAVRYYLHLARRDPVWGWALVHLSMSGHNSFDETTKSIEEGIATGELDVPSAAIGRDIMLGALFTSMISLLREEQLPNYPELIARQIMMGLGASAELIERYAAVPLEDTVLDLQGGILHGGNFPEPKI